MLFFLSEAKQMLLLSLLLLSVFGRGAQAQDKLILLMESGTNYKEQVWFCSGDGNELDEAQIKKNGDNGLCVTSAAYTSKGWFVTMAKNTGLTKSLYYYTSSWPSEWLLNKQKEGCYIMTLGGSRQKWFIVVAAGTGFTDQVWRSGSWEKIRPWVTDKWNAGYRITNVAPVDNGWMVVMSKNSGIAKQNCRFARTLDELRTTASKQWNNGYSLQLINYNEGSYFLVSCTYKNGKSPNQSYRVFRDSPKEFIQKSWDANKDIAYVGGGYVSSSPAAPENRYAQAPPGKPTGQDYQEYEYPFMGGITRMRVYADGSGDTYSETICTLCNASGVCSACNGTGQYWHAYFKNYQPCRFCFGSRKCKYCQGKGKQVTRKHWAPGEAENYLKTQQAVKRIERRSTTPNSNTSPQYMDEIYYTPNYTGKPYADEWCDKCKKWMQPHKHIRKRM